MSLARRLYALSTLLFVGGVVGEVASDHHGSWGFAFGAAILLFLAGRWRSALVDDRAQYEPFPQPASSGDVRVPPRRS